MVTSIRGTCRQYVRGISPTFGLVACPGVPPPRAFRTAEVELSYGLPCLGRSMDSEKAFVSRSPHIEMAISLQSHLRISTPSLRIRNSSNGPMGDGCHAVPEAYHPDSSKITRVVTLPLRPDGSDEARILPRRHSGRFTPRFAPFTPVLPF